MIRKVNIALVAAVAAVLLFKAVLVVLPDGRGGKAPKAAAKASEAAAVPQVHVYYLKWQPFSFENRITNRNGVFLDMMRAIFPGAPMTPLSENAADYARKLSEDPAAVVVGFGGHPLLEGSARAPTPMTMSTLVVRSPRDSSWRYSGPESLDGLRLVARETLLDYSALRERRARFGENSDRLIVVPGSVSYADIANMISSGRADAFVSPGESIFASEEVTSAHIMLRFKTSPPFASEPMLLHVSNVDPEFAKAVVDAYERGLRRIAASGELDRIFGYYGMKHPSVPGEPCDHAR